MSAPGKFDYSSSGPDRSLYRSNLAAQMERSSSLRETTERPFQSSHPSMLRSTSPITQTDVLSFFQCLRFDPKVVAADHKSIRQVDFKRHVNIARGILGDESPSGTLRGKLIPSPMPEEIKRLKAGLRENLVKARERVKIFHEASSVFNKFFPGVPTKKRSRPEGFSNDRSSDRSVLGSGLGKMGIQSQIMSDERPKGVVTNKCTRTTMMDVRNNSIVRQSAAVDRDKETTKLANSISVQGEDRTSSIGIDGWEKSKMKKKRTGIKTDFYPSLGSNKAADGYRETKLGMQLKSDSDSWSRLNDDSHMLRQGTTNGAAGFGRSDSISHQTGWAAHSSVSRADSDHISLYNEKKERSIGSDKERVNLRAVNKMNIHDEFNSSSPTLSTKMNASVRGPRSSSGLPPKLSLVVHSTTSSDWDISSCSSKPPASSGVSNRKRMTSNRSSSPPVTHWAGQRPQKISRIARRTNFGPILSSNDEIPSSDNIANVGCSELGFGFPKCSPAASPQQLKPKAENSLSAAALSESEESGPSEIKSKDKGKQSEGVDQKATQSVQKVLIPVLPLRKKHKFVTGEELGDGVRRQGRTGRGFASTRSPMPMEVEKLNHVGTAKQLRSARLGFDKTESKAGRPPTRKLSDRKAYKRQKHTATNATLDFLVGSDDGHEERLAAVNAVINFARNFSSCFWRQMDPFFRFISDVDIAFLKQQEDLASTALTPVGISSNFDNCEEELLLSKGDSKATPLYQRLLAALISEDSSIHKEFELDGFGTMTELDAESEFNGSNHMIELNGYKMIQKLEYEDSGDNVPGINNLNHYFNGGLSDQLSFSCSELQYDKLGMDEKIYLEAQSIGISIEPVPGISNVEDDAISNDINKLEETLRENASKKKGMINSLLKPVLETKELQEKEFDQLGYEKLVEMAYEKYKANRRHHTAGSKSSSNKLSKQAALTFVRRTLERCHQYEDTANSCFNDPVFRDMLVSGFAQTVDASTDSESMQPAALTGLQPSSSFTLQMGLNRDSYANSSDLLLPENPSLEQRVRKRELLLDDVGIGNSLSTSTKGKRSERDRDGKVQASSRSGTNKIGQASLSNAKAERKSKAKPKQKMTQISRSDAKSSLSKSNDTTSNGNIRDENEFNIDALDETEHLDLSHLQIPDGLGGPDDFDMQAKDLSSWLNIDDDALQDNDLMGLQIPMDDLSDLNMTV